MKSYAAGEHKRFVQLVFNGTRYSFYLLWIVSLPIMLRVNELLDIWLKVVPEWTGQFVIWICIFNLFNSSFCDPIWQGMQAIGKLKKYVAIGSIIYLLAFPLSLLAFDNEASPVAAFQILVFVRMVYFMAAILIFKEYTQIRINDYVKTVLYPIIKVLVVSVIFGYYVDLMLPNTLFGTLVSCLLIVIVIALTIFLIGIQQSERQMVADYVKRKALRK